ncbi:isoprenylcysteine carboxylmethyltransferase family protein [Crocosphaera sp. UHCC 0190]|uniref:methanethiol S-methyltransferase n=1 Tax=Crocosphaera sp. UHCC 0190 TaxID=3110246 RepID=UPI002B218608|nr:methanethiol S-methyltransferase [Crocosphaera sp. UHCC 0190]MEA5509934.1 isoprenylcysteine carboxylmethyltransferase family protein [Crocosphaera sp. UHCC 0190]
MQTQPTVNSFNLGRIFVFLYGVISYIIFLITFLYALGFVGNILVPKSIDAEAQISFLPALLLDTLLLGIFALQHSVMARKEFKAWWTKLIPQPIERSTYVLFSSLALLLIFWQWQPLGGVIWNIEQLWGQIILLSLFGLGWLIVLVSTFLINHFDLFGLRQVYLYLQGKNYTHLEFKTPAFYNYVRHPLYVGWLLAFWMTPKMTVTHLLFAIITTLYILIAIQFEEKDLVEIHGETYENYRRKVPMLIPFFGKKAS